MLTEQSQLVAQVFCEVMEKLAFMFGEPADKQRSAPPESAYIQTKMTYTGQTSGMLALTVPASLCPQIAANVLGIDPDDDRAVASSLDALKEVLNVTCGHVLTALAGETPVFDLSVPGTSTLDAGQWTDLLERPDTVALSVDDNVVLLQFAHGRQA
ncbi:MAG TPA: chemotaxis protein CheX [Phycisphaerae bacterium]|nr:chemotaxis protein CheX [Phycisphaerae bacterium]